VFKVPTGEFTNKLVIFLSCQKNEGNYKKTQDKKKWKLPKGKKTLIQQQRDREGNENHCAWVPARSFASFPILCHLHQQIIDYYKNRSSEQCSKKSFSR
jgi:hypothetical protein